MPCWSTCSSILSELHKYWLVSQEMLFCTHFINCHIVGHFFVVVVNNMWLPEIYIESTQAFLQAVYFIFLQLYGEALVPRSISFFHKMTAYTEALFTYYILHIAYYILLHLVPAPFTLNSQGNWALILEACVVWDELVFILCIYKGSSIVPALGELRSDIQISSRRCHGTLLEKGRLNVTLDLLTRDRCFSPKPRGGVIELNVLCLLTDVQAGRRQWLFHFTQMDFEARQYQQMCLEPSRKRPWQGKKSSLQWRMKTPSYVADARCSLKTQILERAEVWSALWDA